MTPFMKRIESRRNDIVSRYREVAGGADRARVLLDGPHLVADAVAAGVALEHAVVAAGEVDTPEIASLLDRLSRAGVEIAVATAPVMAAISPVRSPSAIVALAVRPGARGVFGVRPALVVIACDVQDPGNLGAIIRVAEAAGATGVVAAGGGADPFGWKALRGSMGSALRLPVRAAVRIEDAVADARRSGCSIVATVPRGGRALQESKLGGDAAILIGGEGAGLPEGVVANADDRLTIPMQPPVESLNTAVATAIVLYEALRQRQTPALPTRLK